MRNRIHLFFFYLILCLTLFCLPADAQEEETVSVSDGPVTGIDLGVSSLHLSVGESYTFDVRFEPADTALRTLGWVVTDENVIRIDPLTDTVTALADGEASIFAESLDRFSYAVCTVTVGDRISKDAADIKSGSDFLGLSPEEMGKIKAKTLIRYLNFVSGSALSDLSWKHAAEQVFDVLAAVRNGTEEKQAQTARECGVQYAEALNELDTVTLTGTLSSILKFIKGNTELKEIYELGPFAIEEPVMSEVNEESIRKALDDGTTQALTDIDYAHRIGLTGKGRWIAVLDSGLDRNNPQFAGKKAGKIEEACFSKDNVSTTSGTVYTVCNDGSTEAGSSAASLAWRKDMFNHGSHVTGIAAGKDGIAPAANIISIQTHTELRWQCKNDEETKAYSCGGSHDSMCCKTFILGSDLIRGHEYLIKLAKSGRKIDAVNMSYGDGGKYTDSSQADDERSWEKKMIDQEVTYGMLPVAAAGNDGYNGFISAPAALSNVYSVGALAAWVSPIKIASFSNHSSMIDLTAPGYKITSAGYSQQTMEMSGTSMATPMVTGGIALVRQLYPGMNGEESGKFLRMITNKYVDIRTDDAKFQFSKPVMNFTNILNSITVPYYNWIVGGNKSVTIKLDRPAYKKYTFSAQVNTLNAEPVSNVKTQWKTIGNYVYVKISSPNLTNDVLYSITLTRTLTVGKNSYKASTTEYGRPTGRMNASSLTIKPGNSSASFTVPKYNGGVQYSVYDGKTGKLVTSVRTNSARKPQEIRGLENGKLYSVTVSSYIPITINKSDGRKENASFYGPESKKYNFVPMGQPSNAKYGYKTNKTAVLSSAADPEADGIWVRYKAPGAKKWTMGCKSTDKNNFSCQITNIDRGTIFAIKKYKIVNDTHYYGPEISIKLP